MGTPNYPRNIADEWNKLRRDVKGAYTSSNMRTGMAKIGAKVVEVSGQIDVTGEINVTDGAVNVKDASNNTRVKLGKQDDGSYDLTAVDPASGDTVNFSTLAFGLQAAHKSGQFRPSTGGSYEDLAGPFVNTTIGTSGRALLMVSATVTCDVGEWISLAVFGTRDGGGSYGPSIGLDLGNKLTASGLGGSINACVGTTDLATNLDPGQWSFNVKFRNVFGVGTPECSQVTLVVMPF